MCTQPRVHCCVSLPETTAVPWLLVACGNFNSWNAKLGQDGFDPDKDVRRFQDLEETAINHYFAIYNDLVCGGPPAGILVVLRR